MVAIRPAKSTSSNKNNRIKIYRETILFVYQKALIRTFNFSFLTTLVRNNFCEFTTHEHKLKRWFCTKKSVWNVRFKDFWYTKKISILQSKRVPPFPSNFYLILNSLTLTNYLKGVKSSVNKGSLRKGFRK